jgi:hypothetical protein
MYKLLSQKFHANQRSKTFWDKALLYLFLLTFSASFLGKVLTSEGSFKSYFGDKQVISKSENSTPFISETLCEGEECLDDDTLDEENDFSDAIFHAAFSACFSQLFVWSDWNLHSQKTSSKRFIELRVLRI